ncbi:MAG TPA: YggS family pyridoxal phosphate-dependent enzyme, partial [Longimicrobiales bacterium]|nr:YggS family pyridoxal phosphate-dependent enzyme [Longimicrobiales bacterium]
MYASLLQDTVPRVREAIAEAAARVGRDGAGVALVAVTKGHPLEAVRAALEAGLTDLGENRVGELEEKASRVPRQGVRWHMVGHVQRRKVPRVIDLADLVHSVDSVRLAERISRVAREIGRDVDVLFQVNASGEEAKYGFDPDEALDRIPEAAGLPRLRARGLMTMAPWTADEKVLRREVDGLERLPLVRVVLRRQLRKEGEEAEVQ